MELSVLMHLNTSLTLPESIPVNETVVSMSFPSEGAAENLHSATLARLSKGEYVSLELLDKICSYLHCNIEDVVEHVPDTPLA